MQPRSKFPCVVAWTINNLIYVLVVGKGLRQAFLFTFPCIVAWTINNLIYVLVVGKGLRQALPFTFPCIVVAWTINNLIYVLVVEKGLRQALPFTHQQHNRNGKVSEYYTRTVYFHSCFSFILTSLCPSSHQKNIINKDCLQVLSLRTKNT